MNGYRATPPAVGDVVFVALPLDGAPASRSSTRGVVIESAPTHVVAWFPSFGDPRPATSVHALRLNEIEAVARLNTCSQEWITNSVRAAQRARSSGGYDIGSTAYTLLIKKTAATRSANSGTGRRAGGTPNERLVILAPRSSYFGPDSWRTEDGVEISLERRTSQGHRMERYTVRFTGPNGTARRRTGHAPQRGPYAELQRVDEATSPQACLCDIRVEPGQTLRLRCFRLDEHANPEHGGAERPVHDMRARVVDDDPACPPSLVLLTEQGDSWLNGTR